MTTVAPYGSWISPIEAADVAAGGVTLAWPLLHGDAVWWTEGRPTEAGRTVVCCRDADGAIADVLPQGWNARTRVHEYGGRPYAVLPDGACVFSNFADQRLYRVDSPGAEPRPLTPEPVRPAGTRYAVLTPLPSGDLLAVEEVVDGHDVRRAIVAVPAGGGAPEPLWSGARFIADLALDADAARLAWVTWEHPDMPWDATRLWVAELAGGALRNARVLAGDGQREALQQPQFAPDGTLYVVTDRTGWWNLHRADIGGEPGSLTNVAPMERECGAPMWQLGYRRYALLGGELTGKAYLQHDFGGVTHSLLDLTTGALTDLDLPYPAGSDLLDATNGRVALVGASPTAPSEVAVVDLASGVRDVVRRVELPAFDPLLLPQPRHETLPSAGGREVHAYVYPPTNPGFAAPEGEIAPYVVFSHGGPTSHVDTALNLQKAYFTSRGIGVVDVDYGGSTGYGRDYRELLRGQWGVVDVEDCVAAARGLAERGEADGARLAIRGGSAGGWTTLACLTRTDAFAAGASYFGVADAKALAEHTHDFESRYLDSMIGPLPEAESVYDERSPLAHLDGLTCPVLLLQGLDDPIVPPAQAEAFVAGLEKAGLPYAYLTFEGESHGFRRADSNIRALQAEIAFYGKVLGFTPAGVPPLELSGPGS